MVDDWKYRPFNLTTVGQNVIVFLVTKTILRDCAPAETFKERRFGKGIYCDVFIENNKDLVFTIKASI